MSLYISSAMPSAELNESEISKAIANLAAIVALAKQQGSVPNGPKLDVTFMLPGPNEKPDFNGMRMGGYNEEEDTLYFERPVPEYIVDSDMARQYVAVVMQDVIEHASDFFLTGGHHFDTEKWLQLLQLVSESDVSLNAN